MKFSFQKSGTVTEIREALNDVVHNLPQPETQENKVIKMLAHHVVADHIDPLHDEWAAKVQGARAARTATRDGGLGLDTPDPTEPTTSVAFDVSVTLG